MTRSDYPPDWVVLPNSSVTADLAQPEWAKRPVIEIRGNRQGLVSLGNLLLWVAGQSDTESFSITGLPFVHVPSALSLTIVQTMDDTVSHATLIRTDKDRQFQWLMSNDILQRQAISIIDLGLSAWFYPRGNHFHGSVAAESEYELFLVREDAV